MMTDMNHIAECPRRKLYDTPTGQIIFCGALPIPTGLSFKDLMANQHLYCQRVVTVDDCETCLNTDLGLLRTQIAESIEIKKQPKRRTKRERTLNARIEDDNSIVFEHNEEDWEPPKDIAGYERDAENSWHFKSLWPSCVKRKIKIYYKTHGCQCAYVKMICRHPDVEFNGKQLIRPQCEQCLKREMKTGETK